MCVCLYVCMYAIPVHMTSLFPAPLHRHHLSRCCQVTVLCHGLVFVGQLYDDDDVTLQCKTCFSFTALAFVKNKKINIFMNICKTAVRGCIVQLIMDVEEVNQCFPQALFSSSVMLQRLQPLTL